MDRRRALACMTLVAGLTLVQAAPAFADGSPGAAAGSATATSEGTADQPAEAPTTDAAPKDEPTEAQASTIEAPKAEAPTVETPKADAPKADAPKADAPKAEAPTAEAKAAAPTSEAATPEPTTDARTQAARSSSAKVAAPSARVTPLADEPSPLSVTLTATAVDVDADGRRGTGDAVDVTATVHAAGPSDITALVVAASVSGDTTVFSCPVTTVAAGADVTCTTRHDLTQADVDAGRVTVTAVATGTVVATTATTSSAPTTLDVTVVGEASLSVKQTITQRSDADRDGRLDAGDLVDVRLAVTNSGTATLERLTISDSLLTRLHVSLSCAASKLAPGASTTCTSVRFAVTRAQATSKVLRNQATAIARTLSGDTVKSATSTASVPVQAPTSTRPSRPTSPKPSTSTAVARLRMSQWIASVTDHDKDGRLDTGDALTFGFRATNVGSLTVHNLRVADRRLQRAGVSVHCPVSSLAPGTSVVCMSGPVSVTAHQAQSGFGRNFAYATGRTSAGTAVRSNSSVTDVGRTAQSAQAAALPRTGSDLADPVLLGLALLLGGATMTVVSRRGARRPA